jgi:tRNA dimethylallyltransferase
MSKHLVLVGATASGKSIIAAHIASAYDQEVISLDSMQIYRGMEIGTGVIDESERAGVIHHMISCRDPRENYSVKHFQTDVMTIISDNPQNKYVLVGGTGLYTHAVVDNFAFAGTDEAIRAQVCEDWGLDESDPDDENVARAYKYLEEVDPRAAKRIDPGNVRRIVRALEAIEITGGKFSDVGEGIQTFGPPAIDVVMVGLRYSREILRQRIVQRIESMFKDGWIDEVEHLLGIWPEMTAPAQNAIGFSLIYDWIMRGKHTNELDTVKEKIAHRTAQFSRRQRKWFERDPRIVWVDCDGLSESEAKNLVLTHYQAK